MNGRKKETDNAENKFQKKRPDVLKRVRIQYILLLLTFILLIGLAVFYIININQVATDTAISSYQQTELEIVREAARGVQEYVYIQTEVLGRKDISAIEQEIYTKLIDPIHLLKNGDAWIYAPDHIVFDKSADLPEEYWGKSMAQIFAIQQKNGASHYEEMTADVTNAREGVGYYVWLPEKGPEIAAWTPVRVGDHTWTIGLSTPLPEILAASGASSQIAMATAVILFSIILALILLSLWIYTDLKRKQIHEELRESEEKFRDIFNNTTEAIHLCEIKDDSSPGRFIDVNEACFRMLGYSKEEMLTKTPFDITTGYFNPPLEKILEDQQTTGTSRFETEHRRKDGSIVPIELNSHVVTIHGKKVVLGVARDITERKKAEEALRESEEKFRDIFDKANDAIEIFEITDEGRPGRYIDVNEVACRMVQYSKDEMLQHSPLDFDITDYNIPPYDEIARKSRSVGHAKFDTGHRRKDGKIIPVEVNFHIITLLGQRVGLAIVRDISERKQAEEELRESEERFRLLFQNANDGILVHEISPEGPGKFLDVNDKVCRLLGYTHDEMAHMSVGDIDVPEQSERIPAIIKQLNKDGHAVFETDFLTKDKERIPVEVSARLFDLRGRQTVLAIIRDITERKAAELQLQHYNMDLEKGIAERTASLHMTTEMLQNEVLQHEIAEKKLQESLNEKSVLLKEIHHRVKNNLQIIASLLNLQSRYITDEKTLQAIKDSQSRVKVMALVHEKLYRSSDISKIDLGDYIKFLGNSLFEFQEARGKGISFKTDIQDISLSIDTAIPLGLIINELISNSLKYAFPGGRKGEISVAIHRQDHTLTILLKDNGVGIPQDFDWRNAKSLGLRLVISLVTQLFGTIELDRTAGTAFTIVVKEKE